MIFDHAALRAQEGKRTAGSAEQQKCSTAGCVSRRLWGWQESATGAGWVDTSLLPTAALRGKRATAAAGAEPAGRSAPLAAVTTMQAGWCKFCWRAGWLLVGYGSAGMSASLGRMAPPCCRCRLSLPAGALGAREPSRTCRGSSPAVLLSYESSWYWMHQKHKTSNHQPGAKHEAAPNAARQRSAAAAIAGPNASHRRLQRRALQPPRLLFNRMRAALRSVTLLPRCPSFRCSPARRCMVQADQNKRQKTEQGRGRGSEQQVGLPGFVNCRERAPRCQRKLHT